MSKLAKRTNQVDNFQAQDSANIKKQKISDSNEIRERIAKRFDNTDKSTRITGSTPSELSSLLPIEKLTALKAKFIAKKREQIAVSENDEELMQQTTNKLIGETNEEDLAKELFSRERIWRNRTTILESNGKRFDTNIFAILQSIKTKEESSLSSKSMQQLSKNDGLSLINNPLTSGDMLTMQITSSSATQSTRLSQSQQNSKNRQLNYSRFDQEQYGPKDDTGGFSIDTKRSYQTGTISLTEPQPSMTPQQSQIKQTQPQAIKSSSTSASSSIPATISSQKRSAMRPIIVVPTSRTSIITLYNSSDILQDLKFVKIIGMREI